MGIFKRSIRAIPLLGPRIIPDGSRERDRDAEDEERRGGPGAEPVVEPQPDSAFLPPPAEQVSARTSAAPDTFGSVPSTASPAAGTDVTDLDAAAPDSAVPPIYPAATAEAPAAAPVPDVPPGAAPVPPSATAGTDIQASAATRVAEPVAPLLRPFPEDAPGLTPTPLLTPSSYYVPKAPAAETRLAPPAAAEARATHPVRTPDPLLRGPAAAPATGETDSAAPYASSAAGRTEEPFAVAATPSPAQSSESPDGDPAETSTASPAAYASAFPAAQSAPAPAGIPVSPSPSASTTSPTLEPNDLNFPNPAVEDNEALREKYSAAVLAGRAGDYARAARLFREYATHHALSRLAPRALFLASILEPDPAQSAEDARNLETRFSDSKYVPELRRRRAAMRHAAPDAVDAGENARSEQIPALEAQLASGLPPAREVTVRRMLGQALITTQDYDRALQVLMPALDAAAGTADEAEILLLISDAAIARRDADQAARALDQLVRRHPDAATRPRVRLNQGLLFEETGSYQRARSVYNALLEESPQTPEAELARERLRDLRML